jgi:peptidoglycan hydrolase CwlO-like protein
MSELVMRLKSKPACELNDVEWKILHDKDRETWHRKLSETFGEPRTIADGIREEQERLKTPQVSRADVQNVADGLIESVGDHLKVLQRRLARLEKTLELPALEDGDLEREIAAIEKNNPAAYREFKEHRPLIKAIGKVFKEEFQKRDKLIEDLQKRIDELEIHGESEMNRVDAKLLALQANSKRGVQ